MSIPYGYEYTTLSKERIFELASGMKRPYIYADTKCNYVDFWLEDKESRHLHIFLSKTTLPYAIQLLEVYRGHLEDLKSWDTELNLPRLNKDRLMDLTYAVGIGEDKVDTSEHRTFRWIDSNKVRAYCYGNLLSYVKGIINDHKRALHGTKAKIKHLEQKNRELNKEMDKLSQGIVDQHAIVDGLHAEGLKTAEVVIEQADRIKELEERCNMWQESAVRNANTVRKERKEKKNLLQKNSEGQVRELKKRAKHIKQLESNIDTLHGEVTKQSHLNVKLLAEREDIRVLRDDATAWRKIAFEFKHRLEGWQNLAQQRDNMIENQIQKVRNLQTGLKNKFQEGREDYYNELVKKLEIFDNDNEPSFTRADVEAFIQNSSAEDVFKDILNRRVERMMDAFAQEEAEQHELY